MSDTDRWKCRDCNDTFESDGTDRHTMNYCECGASFVDHEDAYIRTSLPAPLWYNPETDTFEEKW